MNDQLIEWYFTPLSTVFQSHHGNSSHYSCLSWVSPVLGWCSKVSCPKTFPRKKKKHRIPGLRVNHSTTDPPRALRKKAVENTMGKRENSAFCHPQMLSNLVKFKILLGKELGSDFIKYVLFGLNSIQDHKINSETCPN